MFSVTALQSNFCIKYIYHSWIMKIYLSNLSNHIYCINLSTHIQFKNDKFNYLSSQTRNALLNRMNKLICFLPRISEFKVRVTKPLLWGQFYIRYREGNQFKGDPNLPIYQNKSIIRRRKKPNISITFIFYSLSEYFPSMCLFIPGPNNQPQLHGHYVKLLYYFLQ